MQLLVLFCLVAGALAHSDCPANSHYTNCGTACPLTCENKHNPPKTCVLMCFIGCECDEGYVKTKEGSCVLPEHCQAQASHSSLSVCALPPAETGLCMAYFPRFTYDSASGECKKFIYGGCGGNGNNFKTLEECQTSCLAQQSSLGVCALPTAERGNCKGFFRRFSYDSTSGECKPFIYGGCGGNENNFRTREECQSSCSAQQSSLSVCALPTAERGNCKGFYRRYSYDSASGECKPFIYGGCGGNENNFRTREQCESSCSVQEVQSALDRPDCDKKPEIGHCFAAFQRYYYDSSNGGECKLFIYGGCGGNRNNFQTESECYNKCGALAAPKLGLCQQEKVSGNCRAYIPRYYYNQQSGECERFIYGGCGGNDNNFSSKDHCEQSCKA